MGRGVAVPAPLPPRPLDDKTARLRAARLARDAGRPRVERDPHHRVLGLGDPMPFGKHRGRTIGDLIEEEVGYVTWLLEETAVELSREAEEEYHARLDPRRPRGTTQ